MLAAFYSETIRRRQRSRIDSENRATTRIGTLFNETYNKVTVGSDTMPVRHRLGFKQSSTLRQLKTKMIQFIKKDGRKALHRLGGIGKNLGGILLMSTTTKTYPAPIDQGKLDRKLIGPLFRGMILRINLLQYSSKFGNS